VAFTEGGAAVIDDFSVERFCAFFESLLQNVGSEVGADKDLHKDVERVVAGMCCPATEKIDIFRSLTPDEFRLLLLDITLEAALRRAIARLIASGFTSLRDAPGLAFIDFASQYVGLGGGIVLYRGVEEFTASGRSAPSSGLGFVVVGDEFCFRIVRVDMQSPLHQAASSAMARMGATGEGPGQPVGAGFDLSKWIPGDGQQ
jgi:hypothetical protein